MAPFFIFYFWCLFLQEAQTSRARGVLAGREDSAVVPAWFTMAPLWGWRLCFVFPSGEITPSSALQGRDGATLCSGGVETKLGLFRNSSHASILEFCYRCNYQNMLPNSGYRAQTALILSALSSSRLTRARMRGLLWGGWEIRAVVSHSQSHPLPAQPRHRHRSHSISTFCCG